MRSRPFRTFSGLLVVASIGLGFTGSGRSVAAGRTASALPSAAPSAGAASPSASTSPSASPSPSPSSSTSPSPSTSPSASPSRTSTPTPTPTLSTTAAADPATALADAVARTVSANGGHVSVAVADLSSGAAAGYNISDDYVTASIFKLDILASLLYQDQRQGTSPSDEQRSLITAMIENSDNASATQLYNDQGGSGTIDASNKAFGMTDTDIYNAAFGDTTTTATDQIHLLRQVFSGSSVLSSANRSYIQNLLAHVETDQRWGVSAAADDSDDDADDYFVKNGWLPRSSTGLWEINSIGEAEHDGREYLVAVLSSDNESMDGGVSAVEQTAKEAVDAIG